MRWLMLVLLIGLPAWAQPADLAGRWTLDGEAQLQGVSDAIDRTVDTMSMLYRAMARPVMHRSITAVTTYAIELQGDRLLIGKDGAEAKPVHLDGATRKEQGRDGKVAQVHTTVLPAGVEHHWKREDSQGSDRFVLDGGRLLVTRTIDSKHFSEPVVFTTTYVK